MELSIEIREQAKQEAAENKAKSKMSEKQAARLRSIGEQEKADKAANKEFALQFLKLPSGTYEHLLQRMSTDQTFLGRRAEKLSWALSHGWTVGTSHDVMFLSTLTRDEEAMTDAAFSNHLEKTWIYPEPGTVRASAIVEERRCALGKGCFKAKNRQGALVTGRGDYCSRLCSTSPRANKHAKSVAISPETKQLAIVTQ